MDKLKGLLDSLEEETIRRWEDFPDMLLYMDQLLLLMEDQIYFARSQQSLTSSMVNNYVKAGIVPRAEKKKYDRNHLARLSMIGVLKQVLSLEEMEGLFARLSPGKTTYERYLEILEGAKEEVLEEVRGLDKDIVLLHLAMKSYLFKILIQELLNED